MKNIIILAIIISITISGIFVVNASNQESKTSLPAICLMPGEYYRIQSIFPRFLQPECPMVFHETEEGIMIEKLSDW